MTEPVFSMKTSSKDEYFYMRQIIISEGLTVTPGSKAAKTICFFNLLITSWLVASLPDIILDAKQGNEKRKFAQNPTYEPNLETFNYNFTELTIHKILCNYLVAFRRCLAA